MPLNREPHGGDIGQGPIKVHIHGIYPVTSRIILRCASEESYVITVREILAIWYTIGSFKRICWNKLNVNLAIKHTAWFLIGTFWWQIMEQTRTCFFKKHNSRPVLLFYKFSWRTVGLKGSTAPLLLLASKSVETCCLWTDWIFALWGVSSPSSSKRLLHSFLRF